MDRLFRTLRNRVMVYILLVLVLFVISILGYILIKIKYENGNPTIVDALYWTISTITTLGSYPSDVELTSKVGKIFTTLIVSSGIIIIFAGIPLIIAPWLEEKIKRIVHPALLPIPEKQFVIVCGYSDTGKEIVNELKIHNFNFVVVDKSSETISELASVGIPYVLGDATNEEILEKAGIRNAKALISVINDSTNAFICLTAKKIRPDLRIVTTIEDIKNESVLYRAGATYVIDSKSLTGNLLGLKTVGKYDIDISEKVRVLEDMEINQYSVTEDNSIFGLTLAEADIGKKTGVIVIGIWKNGKLIVNPSPDEVIDKNSILMIAGKKENITIFEEFIK